MADLLRTASNGFLVNYIDRLDFSSPKMFQNYRIVADYKVLKWFFQKRLIKTLQNNDFFTVFGSFW